PAGPKPPRHPEPPARAKWTRKPPGSAIQGDGDVRPPISPGGGARMECAACGAGRGAECRAHTRGPRSRRSIRSPAPLHPASSRSAHAPGTDPSIRGAWVRIEDVYIRGTGVRLPARLMVHDAVASGECDP